MTKPRLLDLFCGGGGAGVGYHRAGFTVVGVDNRPQPRYPFEFHQADALEFLAAHGHEYDAIHASPPCQRFSSATFFRLHEDLLTPTIELLQALDRLWIVENVPRAPLSSWSTELCGLMFDLKVLRHRRFECRSLILSPPHPSHRNIKIGVNGFACLAGCGDASRQHRIRTPADHRTKAAWARAIGIDWMTRDELAQAIPPAYTEYIGGHLRRIIENRANQSPEGNTLGALSG
jgi:DNA (cytosine-5)-methyltransferase 1